MDGYFIVYKRIVFVRYANISNEDYVNNNVVNAICLRLLNNQKYININVIFIFSFKFIGQLIKHCPLIVNNY